MSDDLVRVPHDGVSLDNPNKEAVRFHIDGKQVWIPRSQLEDYGDDEMEIPRWLAEDREIDHEEIDRPGKVSWKK